MGAMFTGPSSLTVVLTGGAGGVGGVGGAGGESGEGGARKLKVCSSVPDSVHSPAPPPT